MTGVRSTRPPAPNPMTGTPRDASMMTGKSAGNEVPTVPPAPAPVARAKTAVSQAASVTSVTGTRACRALCVALRKRLIPTLILVPLSECRVVTASSRDASASLPIGRARKGRPASDGSSSSIVAPERLGQLHKTLDPGGSRVKSSPGTPTLARRDRGSCAPTLHGGQAESGGAQPAADDVGAVNRRL